MNEKVWFFHLGGEALGPFSTAALTRMIQQNRCNAADFVWTEGMAGWQRAYECEEFTAVLPATPHISVPSTPVPKATKAPIAAKPVAAKAAPVAKPTQEKTAPVVKASSPPPSPAPIPEPEPEAPEARVWKLPLDAKVKINGGAPSQVLDISEGGLVFEKGGSLEMGADVKIRVESPSLAKPLELTAIVVREEYIEGKPGFGVEFTRMNPAHRRVLAQYVNSRLATPGDRKAA